MCIDDLRQLEPRRIESHRMVNPCEKRRDHLDVVRDIREGLRDIEEALRDIERDRFCEGLRDIEEGIRDIREGERDIISVFNKVFHKNVY